MKIITTINDVNEIKESLADGFIIGSNKYASRLNKSFSSEEIEKICKVANEYDKDIFIKLNIIMHQEDITRVRKFLKFLSTLKVTGIYFGDYGIYTLAKELDMESSLIYSPDTLVTSYEEVGVWQDLISGVTISKEITLEDILIIRERTNINLHLYVHGFLPMFHSKRPLVSNYFKLLNYEVNNIEDRRDLYLIEETRKDKYKVIEDESGVHVFRPRVLNSIDFIDELENSIDYAIIDGIFKDTEYVNRVIEAYRNKDKTLLPMDKYDRGFYKRKTKYKR